MENFAHDPAGRRTPRPVRPVRATLGAWLLLFAGVVGLFGVVLAGTIASGEWLETAERPDGSTAFDRSITSWMVDHRASGATFIARVFSAVGSQKALVPLVAILALALIRQRGWRSLGLLVVAWGGAILLYSLAKHAVGRPRPPADLWLTHAAGKAFPSGHAVQSLSTFVALAVIAATLVRPRIGSSGRRRRSCSPPGWDCPGSTWASTGRPMSSPVGARPRSGSPPWSGFSIERGRFPVATSAAPPRGAIPLKFIYWSTHDPDRPPGRARPLR